MDILISIIIAGFAAGYALEFLSSLVDRWISPKILKQILTLPLSFVALWLLGLHGEKLFVFVPAAGFVSLVIMALVSKPIEVTQVVNRR